MSRKYCLNFASSTDFVIDAKKVAALFDRNKLMVKISPGFLAGRVAEARDQESAPSNPKEMKWECKGLAKAVRNMLLVVELESDPTFSPYAPEASALFPRLLVKPGTKLRTA